MKIVINTCYGGFSLSDKAFEKYLQLKGTKFYSAEGTLLGKSYYTVPKEEYESIYAECVEKGDYTDCNDLFLSMFDIERNDPILIQVVEELGDEANGRCATLKIVEIPDGVQWEIEEYDGVEWIAEVHRTWS